PPALLPGAAAAVRDGGRASDLLRSRLVPQLERDQPSYGQHSVCAGILCRIGLLDGSASRRSAVSGGRRSGANHLVHAAERGAAVSVIFSPAVDSLSWGIPLS